MDIFNEGKKCLVFTERITTAEDMIKRFEKKGLKAINIFSQNSSKKDMNDEQNRIRNAIIERGIFIGDYDILIINGAYETGINILDERFEVCILDTEVNTKRTQSRARIRKDIEIAFYKDKDCKNYNIELNEKWLNRPLDTSEKKALANDLDLRNPKNNRIMKWRGIRPLLEDVGYKIKDCRKTAKNISVTIISKDE